MNTMESLQLANKPTPVEFLETTSNRLGISLWVKRDDLTGDILSGGNKIRKLEYLLQDAKSKGADTIVVGGGTQSNLVKATTALSLRLGLQPMVVLVGDQPSQLQANYFLITLMGVEMHFIANCQVATLEEEMYQLSERLKLKGKNPYIIPFGGANGLGTLGYIDAYGELEIQKREKNLDFDWEFVAVGSGGTLAGIILGHQLHHSKSKIAGISVLFEEKEARNRVLRCISREGENNKKIPEIQIDDQFIGDGYGIPTKREINAIRQLAQDEALMFDHVYSGKAMAGLLHYAKQGMIQRGESVLFWHTGGAPGLFTLGDQLDKI